MEGSKAGGSQRARQVRKDGWGESLDLSGSAGELSDKEGRSL